MCMAQSSTHTCACTDRKTEINHIMCGIKFVLFISGEFTLRAFLNGRLDLSQAENVRKLISAKSIVAAEAALAGIQACLISALR